MNAETRSPKSTPRARYSATRTSGSEHQMRMLIHRVESTAALIEHVAHNGDPALLAPLSILATETLTIRDDLRKVMQTALKVAP